MLKPALIGLLATAGLAMLGGPAAATGACSGMQCNDVYVTVVQVQPDGLLWFGTSGDEASLSCTPPFSGLFQIPASAVGRDQILATLLTMQTSNTRVYVGLHAGGGNVCVVTWIQVQKAAPGS